MTNEERKCKLGELVKLYTELWLSPDYDDLLSAYDDAFHAHQILLRIGRTNPNFNVLTCEPLLIVHASKYPDTCHVEYTLGLWASPKGLKINDSTLTFKDGSKLRTLNASLNNSIIISLEFERT